MSIFPSFGGAAFSPNSRKVIRLILKGCTNRPFFHISVQEAIKEAHEPVIEQIGNYDPLPNEHNEKLVAINFDRLEYWLKQGADTTEPVDELLGLCGYYPIHPNSLKDAWIKRKNLAKIIKKLKLEVAQIVPSKDEKLSVESVSETSETIPQEDELSTKEFLQPEDDSNSKEPKS